MHTIYTSTYTAYACVEGDVVEPIADHRQTLVAISRSRTTHTSAYVSICQHTSAYVSIRQHTSAYVSIRQHLQTLVATSRRFARRGGGGEAPFSSASFFVSLQDFCTSKARNWVPSKIEYLGAKRSFVSIRTFVLGKRQYSYFCSVKHHYSYFCTSKPRREALHRESDDIYKIETNTT